MRALLNPDLMPVLHYSTYDIPGPVLKGFEEQSREVLVGIHAIIDRARKECTDLIIEGAHLIPGQIKREGIDLYEFVLHIEDSERHKLRFITREQETPERIGQRYLESFDRIREIQSYVRACGWDCEASLIATDEYDIETVAKHVAEFCNMSKGDS